MGIRHAFYWVLVSVLLLSGALDLGVAQAADIDGLPLLPRPRQPAADSSGFIIVRQRSATASVLRSAQAELHVQTVEDRPTLGAQVWSVPLGTERAAAERVAALPGVEYAEPDYRMYALGVPNDPYFSRYQWNMYWVDAPAAWDMTAGNPSVKVAVIDSGFDITHGDRPAYLENGCDWVAWRTYNLSGTCPRVVSDPDGHGTHVTGLLAARQNNGYGMSGLAPNVTVLVLRTLDANGSGYSSDLASAIIEATNSNARIINISLGSTADSQTVRNAVTYAQVRNVLIVSAAGNNFAQGNAPTYPAAVGGVFAVGAGNFDHGRSWYSTTGPYISLIAPGGDPTSSSDNDPTHWILSLVPGGQFAFASGTSMASPHVAATAALMLSVKPGLSANELADILRATARPISGTRPNDSVGWGYLNTHGAVLAARNAAIPSHRVAFLNQDIDLSPMNPGDQRVGVFRLRNIGTTPWRNDVNPVGLATSNPRDRASAFYTPGAWVSSNRAAYLKEREIGPGDVGTFQVLFTAPAQGGTYREYFNPVADGLTWFNDLGLYLPLTVRDVPAYQVSFVSQSIDLSPMSPGDTRVGTFRLRNVGTATWTKDRNPVLLGTSNARDRESPFYTPGAWASRNRVAYVKEDRVAPGEVGTFEVAFTAPSTPGSYREYFNPVAEGLTWLNDLGLYLSLTVQVPAYQVAFVSQSIDLSLMSPGEQRVGTFFLRNTGTATWRKDRNPVLLGTSNPRDRLSSFYTPGAWASRNRVAYVKEATVAPGEIGTFEVVFTAPSTPGSYREYFNPVAEGLTWLNDLGLYLSLTVR